ncbi:hypothetical protein GLOTRDRAFT_127047 [Gloeophyllum trabeum ATCC 11539]|uniref:Uncharacterized protein n=1 Tax=Gloeophyllum trabeum (strain ATCC 11539 / FP-39264 / Madison 617) TaxID=670483 RepID=S7QH42_GLOTA|nr:uncharacterized protein GLOTRDRAFT_127047 [Gloeophyllum trabeum ATCC 11539]EPQ58548.1 hypothetical protein GLOTRDRAFT_127047 [Gloeophyllum trabeum ATCC 11539]
MKHCFSLVIIFLIVAFQVMAAPLKARITPPDPEWWGRAVDILSSSVDVSESTTSTVQASLDATISGSHSSHAGHAHSHSQGPSHTGTHSHTASPSYTQTRTDNQHEASNIPTPSGGTRPFEILAPY